MQYSRSKEDRVVLLKSEALIKQTRDAEYLMELDINNLLFPYYYEAGLTGSINYKKRNSMGAGNRQPVISEEPLPDIF